MGLLRVGAYVAAASLLVLVGCSDADEASGAAGAGQGGSTSDGGQGGLAGAGGAGGAPGTGAGGDGGSSVSLSCHDVPLPAAPDPMAITVNLRDLATFSDVSDVAVTAHWRSDDAVIVMETTDSEGQADFSFATEGKAADVYFEFDATGYVKMFTYTGWPLYEDEVINMAVVSNAFVGDVALVADVELDDDKGHVVATARDCSLATMEDVEFQLTSNFDQLKYLAGGGCDALVEDLSGTTKCGRMVAMNVEPGELDLSGSLINGADLRTQKVVVQAGAVTWVTMRPDRPGP